MQTLGYMNLRGAGKAYKAKVLVLASQGKDCRYFKVRKGGKDGVHFSDEELYLNERVNDGDCERINELLNGEVICL